MKSDRLKTPCYVVDESAIIKNLEILRGVMDKTGCRILLAQKAFSMFALYPLIGSYLSGTASSGLYEARLGREYMGKENHVYAPAFKDDEFDEILSYGDHIVFNSVSQLKLFSGRTVKSGASIGLRINPECSTQKGHDIYDPCAPFSRLGVTAGDFLSVHAEELDAVDGLHFHTLCEQNADALEATLNVVEERFGPWLYKMKWLNFGGGHHITRPDYDIPLLESLIKRLSDKYCVQVYLEPGEAIALNAGFLITTVLACQKNRIDIAILDTSAACHMPDVLEMPYRPTLKDSGLPREKPFTYRLAGPTCLAGDVIGDYSFDLPLERGKRLVFEDMAIYTMVKNNTFNGMPLPSIVLKKKDGDYSVIRSFDYDDFKNRLS
ncbi:MAG: carboxynorspermidine decarboxylase [Clostridiales bacterium]|nr:carboxynorspermidine decarboxylase [Clostridiales bacterium]